jgi:hypothetical protein
VGAARVGLGREHIQQRVLGGPFGASTSAQARRVAAGGWVAHGAVWHMAPKADEVAGHVTA